MAKREPILMDYVGVPPKTLARAIVAFHLRGVLANADTAELDAVSVAAIAQMAREADARVGEPVWVPVRSELNGDKPPFTPKGAPAARVRRAEAARILGVSTNTIDRAIKRNALRAKRDKGGVYFDADYLAGLDGQMLLLRKRRR